MNVYGAQLIVSSSFKVVDNYYFYLKVNMKGMHIKIFIFNDGLHQKFLSNSVNLQ